MLKRRRRQLQLKRSLTVLRLLSCGLHSQPCLVSSAMWLMRQAAHTPTSPKLHPPTPLLTMYNSRSGAASARQTHNLRQTTPGLTPALMHTQMQLSQLGNPPLAKSHQHRRILMKPGSMAQWSVA